MATETAPSAMGSPANGHRSLAALRGEAAALHERAARLAQTCRAIEDQLNQLLGHGRPGQAERIAELRQAARDTVRLLEETVRRRGAVRAQITELERAAALERTAQPRVIPEPLAAPTPPPPAVEPPAAAPPATAQPPTPAQPQPPALLAAAPVPHPPRIARQRLERLPGTGRRWSTALRRVARPRHALSVVLGAALIVLLVLLTPVPELFGWQLYAVETGSMEPAIPVGSVVAVRPVRAGALRVGDVITFSDRNRPDVRVTHRIVELELKNGQQSAVTKGDANNTTDSWSVPIDRDVGRVEFHVPFAGYVMYWLSSPSVKLAALVAAALLFVSPQLRSSRRGGQTQPEFSASPPRAPDGEPSLDDLTREIEALLGQAIPSAPAERK